MMSIHGRISFDKQFYRSGKFVHQKILARCRKIVKLSLLEELSLTIEAKSKSQSEEHTLQNILNKVANDNLDDLPSFIQSTFISVSYDMG